MFEARLQIVLLAALSASAADITGQWRAEIDTQIGLQKYIYNLQAKGETLTGKAVLDFAGSRREVDLQQGRIAGDVVTFSESFRFQDMDIRIDYTGKMAGDDDIKFSRQVGEFATEEFTAHRVKEAPKPPAAPIALGPNDKAAFPAPPPGFDVALGASVKQGALALVEYNSTTVGTRRRMQVYTPPGYAKSREYPVLFLLHGIGATKPSGSASRPPA